MNSKFKGIIMGIASDEGSVYSILSEDYKCYIWRADVTAEETSTHFHINFTWHGNKYKIDLKKQRPDYYTGKVQINNQIEGNSYFWIFKKGDDEILMKGDYEEDGICFNSFVELKLV